MNKRQSEIVGMLEKAYPNCNTHAFNVFDFVHAFGSGRDALMYSQILWPDFVEFRGMVFLNRVIELPDFETRITEALGRTKSSAEVEWEFNLTEITHLFGRRMGETDDSEDRLLAEIMSETWAGKLKAVFPGRSIKLEIVPPETVDGASALTFCTM